ncbi:MAG: hypothetical protein RLZZ440_1528 [Planctomycetota bacterium]
MLWRWLRTGVVVLLALSPPGSGLPALHAQQAGTTAITPASVTAVETLRPAVTIPRPMSDHPLAWVLKFAHDEQTYLQHTVRDFTCRVTKRERIEGELQDYYFIDMSVREHVAAGTKATQPFSVMLEFLGPADVAGRRALYVAGQNDDRLLVRKGGRRFGYLVIDVDPFGPSVKRESLMPITELGFSQLLERTIHTLEQDVAADPHGDNTVVEHITTATINGRPCQMLRITHPLRRDGLQFYSASMCIDSELHVPVRFDVYDWPETPSHQPPLVAEFTYTNVVLNANLDDAIFTRTMLRRP